MHTIFSNRLQIKIMHLSVDVLRGRHELTVLVLFLLLQDSKTKTWPPKAPWQHSTHSNTMPNPSSSLYQMTIPSSQWGDSMQILQSPVWSTASECSPSSGLSSGFPFTQQQQQQQVSQHKALSKGFKNFPLKPEHRPSYLHQY